MKLVVLSALLLLSLVAVSSAEEFDFFYLVQQWPGSFCDTKKGCCFPDTGKPATDFGIHGLWPNYAECKTRGELDGALEMVTRRRKKCWPESCNSERLKLWEIRDLVTELDANWPTLACKGGKSFEFWTHEWEKHGTCSNLDQHGYFATALGFKARHNLTSILADAGIVPSDTETYFLSSIRDAIREGTGFTANLECNRGVDGETQLFQVYQCIDRDGENLIDCPLPMQGNCKDRVQLPAF
ncbi:aleurone ribonuclease [Hordeum vulgare]|uniref:Uncharacterized protein n=1 Tax=Hordeum vulgare subsp. vulgare TaxID=112509 RepID=A0A8I7B2D4_HORVV|nr:ribonuclease 1-like [Hordeum vulgare subsp. vulgare]KAE8812335.1 aleurone ribonuclease [Hordeum vulgare]KAI5008138.1 hypothetical protein ZWY2020_009186 [Hordeum vulgare]